LVDCEILRIRTSIALGAFDDATVERATWTRTPGSVAVGELTACRALACACAKQFTRAEELNAASHRYIQVAQTKVMQTTTRLLVASGRSEPTESIRDALERAVTETGSLDYLVTACRGAPFLVPLVCASRRLEQLVMGALRRSRDAPSLAAKGHADDLNSQGRTPAFSPREEQVFALLCRGSTNKQIARTLFISDVTVKVHLRHIYRKLGVTTRLEAVALGLAGLVDT
jgi:Response regulator containing a CheY-like receiver domain and an HTH DNA-binding domain